MHSNVCRRLGAICGGMVAFGGLAGETPAEAQTCPFESIRAAVQAHDLDAWKPSLNIVEGQRFRIGGFNDDTGVPSASGLELKVKGPKDYVIEPPVNGVYVDAPYAGTYTLKVRCGALSATATVTAAATSVTTPAPQRADVYDIGVAWGSQWRRLPESLVRDWDRANLDMLVEAGSASANPSFDWVSIQPTPDGRLSWSYADHQVAEAEARGLQMFAYTGNTPDWALPAHQHGLGHRYPPDELYQREFKEFHETLARRYCGRIRYYQFWNEPNGCSWVNDGCANSDDESIRLYVKWLERWYVAMKNGCSDVVLAIGGLDCNLGTGAGCGAYVSKVIELGGGESFDAVAMHPYGSMDSNETALNFPSVAAVTNALAAEKQDWKKLWLNEWGYNSSNEIDKPRRIKSVLRELARPEYSNVFMARYLTVTDVPGAPNRWGLCDSSTSSLVLTPRNSFWAFRRKARGEGADLFLQNARLESNSTDQFGRITGWGPSGGWSFHRQFPRPNNHSLSKAFGFYAAASETVGQVLSGTFESAMIYNFRSWAHGGGDDTGVVPYQIGYAATNGDLGSFIPLATATVPVGNTWFETNGVTYRTGVSGPELGKQIIVRFGNGTAGGSGDVWFDNPRLTVSATGSLVPAGAVEP